MENTLAYWKERCNLLLAENSQLKSEIESLKQQLHKSTVKNEDANRRIKELSEEISMSPIQDWGFEDDSYFESLAQSVCSSRYSIRQVQSPQNTSKKSYFDFQPMIQSQVDLRISMNLQSIEKPRLVEYFFVVGVSAEDLSQRNRKAAILMSVPDNIEWAGLSVLADFCFPAGISASELVLSKSGSALNQLIFGHNYISRAENSYVFTIKANEPRLLGDNNWSDVLYCCCVTINDVGVGYGTGEWAVPKCYCLVSYYPHFTLFFDIISKVLVLKRVRRMQELINIEPIDAPNILRRSEELGESETKLIAKCIGINSQQPNSTIRIEEEMIEPISITWPEEVWLYDIPWLLSPLFSTLRFQDTFWVLIALLLEKSVVVVSSNLSLLTSSVLAFAELLKPLIWPHVVIPIVPDSLREILEAPVPVLLGLPAPAPPLRKSYSNLIWLMLDEPSPQRRLQASTKILRDVKEPYFDNFKTVLNKLYAEFTQERTVYIPSHPQQNACKDIANLLRGCWGRLLEKFPRRTSGRINPNDFSPVIESSHLADKKFLESFTKTQLLVSHLENC
ncbi:unnamed protein product [Blepharisma stoltei]|uniref:UDENN domain-containing protein n=1 Tax=Blepharisma stoltei TaxID=1481888 RepID=A0AAU9IX30_9CILI|nr:unnamed protein product [Blepharisma stoltei]